MFLLRASLASPADGCVTADVPSVLLLSSGVCDFLVPAPQTCPSKDTEWSQQHDQTQQEPESAFQKIHLWEEEQTR